METKDIQVLIDFYNSRDNSQNESSNITYSTGSTPSQQFQSLVDKYDHLYSNNNQNPVYEPYLNKKFYHITNYEALKGIKSEGFKCGKTGMLGGGIYFAERPWCAYRKSLSANNDVIIVALLKVGRCLTERWAHRDWNLQKVNEMGYDSVQMRHCRTGIEICLYEPSRVKIIDVYFFVSEDESTIRYSHEKDPSRIIEFEK